MARELEFEDDCRRRKHARSRPRVSPHFVRDRLGWLDAPLRWRDGRLYWQWRARAFAPQEQDFAVIRRLLRQAENDRRFGPAELKRWHLQVQRARRVDALRLVALDNLDWLRYAGLKELQKLTDFLELELTCPGDLKAPPSLKLYQAGGYAEPALRRLLQDAELSQEQRALIMMLLASWDKGNLRSPDGLATKAIQFASRFGFSSDAAVAIHLLSHLSVSETERVLTTLRHGSEYSLSARDILEPRFDLSVLSRLLDCRKPSAGRLGSLNFGCIQYRNFVPGLEQELCVEWRRYRRLQMAKLRRSEQALLRIGRPELIPALSELFEQIIGILPGLFPAVRLDRRPSQHPFHRAHWRHEFLGHSRRLWRCIRTILESTDPASGIVLLRDIAASLNEDLKNRREELVHPNDWAHEWDQELRRRLRLFESVVQVGEKVGWELAREMFRLGVLSRRWLHAPRRDSQDWYLTALKLVRWVSPESSYDVADTWMKGTERWSCPQTAFRRLQPLLAAMSGLRGEERGDWLDPLLESLHSYNWNGKTSLRHLIPLFRFMRAHLKDTHYSRVESAWQGRLLLTTGSSAVTSQQWRRVGELANFINAREEADLSTCRWFLTKAMPILSGMNRVELDWPSGVWERLWTQLKDSEMSDEVFYRAGEILLGYPLAILALQQNLQRQPSRVLKSIFALGHSPYSHPEIARGLAPLTASLWQPLPAQSDWSALLKFSPTLRPVIQRYRSLRLTLNEVDTLPARVRAWLEWPAKVEEELCWLREKLAGGRHELKPRVTGLEARLADEAGWQSTAVEEIREAMEAAVAELNLRLLERAIDDGYRVRLQAITGPLPPDLRVDAALRNAAGLSLEIPHNRKWLRHLLRAHFRGENRWREQIPANAKFLRELESRGTNPDTWLARHSTRFRLPFGQIITLELCADPLEILQMGNYFQTCLSLGEINSFSTVANAVDLNKRVLYARDAHGRVIGRQLLALNENGELVGFRVYRSMDHKDSEILCGYFNQYVMDFAAACGLKLGDGGEVPRLCAADWYDDGIVSWSQTEIPEVAAAAAKLENVNVP